MASSGFQNKMCKPLFKPTWNITVACSHVNKVYRLNLGMLRMKISHCSNCDQNDHGYQYTVVFLKCLQNVKKKKKKTTDKLK